MSGRLNDGAVSPEAIEDIWVRLWSSGPISKGILFTKEQQEVFREAQAAERKMLGQIYNPECLRVMARLSWAPEGRPFLVLGVRPNPQFMETILGWDGWEQPSHRSHSAWIADILLGANFETDRLLCDLVFAGFRDDKYDWMPPGRLPGKSSG